eukprot:TRINITY_DN164_c0_g1_i4.p3 TRINITY_DN164_c0_g1~~TRINITY_DN164_c0_g1_i4.p3  ORF type:complete len:105 (-),score=8.20 TRINITY_DN164_c0_g1_i4:123-437(-)
MTHTDDLCECSCRTETAIGEYVDVLRDERLVAVVLAAHSHLLFHGVASPHLSTTQCSSLLQGLVSSMRVRPTAVSSKRGRHHPHGRQVRAALHFCQYSWISAHR